MNRTTLSSGSIGGGGISVCRFSYNLGSYVRPSSGVGAAKDDGDLFWEPSREGTGYVCVPATSHHKLIMSKDLINSQTSLRSICHGTQDVVHTECTRISSPNLCSASRMVCKPRVRAPQTIAARFSSASMLSGRRYRQDHNGWQYALEPQRSFVEYVADEKGVTPPQARLGRTYDHFQTWLRERPIGVRDTIAFRLKDYLAEQGRARLALGVVEKYVRVVVPCLTCLDQVNEEFDGMEAADADDDAAIIF
ncbi:hypothetical protein GGR51DRAFT_556418 [Nemania sp. FL0031]|nr:hypothetical protein GGR51DRAFT_556418 [Nemania sp. FL0031]